jgi:hypothetical protein
VNRVEQQEGQSMSGFFIGLQHQGRLSRAAPWIARIGLLAAGVFLIAGIAFASH